MEWARILAYITGTVDQELLLRNEYLAAENRVLGGKLKGRRRKRRTELLHRGSLDNCHLCDRFNFLTIRDMQEKVAKATLIAVEIVRKNPNQVGFVVNPRRWVVERFFAWIGRNRRLAKDFEATIDSARALRRLRHAPRTPDRTSFMTFETDS
jgi:transposase